MGDITLPAVPNRIGLSTPAFPKRYPNLLVKDNPLQEALNDAITNGPGERWPAAVAIVSDEPLDTRASRPTAHFRGDEFHYAASLIKVAAMYSAFELRKTVRAVAKELGASVRKDEVLGRAATHLNAAIMEKTATLPGLRGIKEKHALPRYESTFDVVPAENGDPGFTVVFTSKFKKHLSKMISVSSNEDAGESIHGSGYGYLNGALESAGFFSSGAGIWLAGDYMESKDKRKYPAFRIPSLNDGPTAQGGTALSLAHLFTLAHDGMLVDAPSSKEMLDLLAEAVAVPEIWINRSRLFDLKVIYNKLGTGPANAGPDLFSETSVVQHGRSGRRFVVSWQNFRLGRNEFDPIAAVVRNTIVKFLTPGPP